MNTYKNWFLTLSLLAIFVNAASADINDLLITEVWPGRSGADGTQDWIEITNTGDEPVLLAPSPGNDGVAYDDESADINSAFVLPNETLAPGESIVLIVDIVADNALEFPNAGAEFTAVWQPFDAILIGADAAGLSNTNGDTVNLLNATTGAVIDSFPAAIGGDVSMQERIGPDPTDTREAVLGENGAFESQEFIDEDTGEIAVDGDGNSVRLIGSPGVFTGFITTVLPGDTNGDGLVDLLDVAPFVELILNGEFDASADLNGDGVVDLLDIAPFVELLL